MLDPTRDVRWAITSLHFAHEVATGGIRGSVVVTLLVGGVDDDARGSPSVRLSGVAVPLAGPGAGPAVVESSSGGKGNAAISRLTASINASVDIRLRFGGDDGSVSNA